MRSFLIKLFSKVYLDTAIWRDYFEDRADNIKPLGAMAFQFLKYCEENDFKILFSSFVIKELLTYYSKDRVEIVFENWKKYLVEAEETGEIMQKALELKEKLKIPLVDIVHALLAKANNAVLISRDKHFEKLNSIAETMLPEDFI